MQGADEYCRLFKETKQYNCLYVVPGSHARGDTFHLYVLPLGEAAKPNGPNAPLNPEAVEVYGIVSGNPGWTETYGWLHKGLWQQDFEKLVRSKELELEDKQRREQAQSTELKQKEQDRV